jgi:hypothetical protein
MSDKFNMIKTTDMVKDQVKNDVKNEVKNDVENDIKNDVENDIKYDVENNVDVETKLNTVIKLKGWWGNTSVLIDPSCSLYKFKFDVIDALIKEGLIKDSDLDSRNKVAHIMITNRGSPKNDAKFDFYQNKQIVVTFDDIRVNKDFAEVRLIGGVHMTIVYKKNIGEKKMEILQVLSRLFNEMCRM